jgi:hypothetical protein
MVIFFISDSTYKACMTRQILIILIGLISFTTRCLSQNISIDDRLREIIRQDGQAIVSIPLTGKKSVEILTRNVSIISVKDKIINISLSSLTIDWFLSQKYNYHISEKKASKELLSSSSLTQALEWETYPTYLQYDSIMKSFAIRYPALCRLDTIGTSIYGKRVLALKISDNVSVDEDEPEVFYTSTIHGDETGGFIMMLRLADYLLKNYNSNIRVKNLVDNLEIWINPLANPDGTYRTGNSIIAPIRYNANGFDLNRNFPDPVTPNTVKQKETIDMMKFLRKHRFVISANFHSGEEVVNYPWDRYLYKFHADDSWLNSISRAYADTAHVYSGPSYMNALDNGVTRGADWYIVYGGRQDYVTWELQGREVTIELDDQFITPAAQLSLLWQYNWRSLLGYLENALYGIHGLVQDVRTSHPVPAKVFIKDHDKDSSQIYSDTTTGRFVRFLSPGTWNLTFSAKGFKDTTVNNVVVYSHQRTDLLVSMKPAANSIYPTIPVVPVIYPNPASGTVKIKLPDQIVGSVLIKIYNNSGMLVSEFNTETEQGNPLTIDIKELAGGTYSISISNNPTHIAAYGRFIVVK